MLKDTLPWGNGPVWVSRLSLLGVAAGVTLWLVDLARLTMDGQPDVLSSQEHRSAEKLVDASQRHRYLAAHWALRHVLANHLGLGAEELEFFSRPNGKPFLLNDRQCEFNLSHSGDWAIIAMTNKSDALGVGVDLEVFREIDDLKALSIEVLDTAELSEFNQLPLRSRSTVLLHAWVRKEAALKAIGTGLRISPKRVNVGLTHRPATIKIRDDTHQHQVQLWSMTHPLGFALAIAVERAP